VTPTYVTSADWIYNADLKTPYSTYNPELAKTLLAEAGYTKDTKITISVIQRDPDVQISELIQAQLKKLGIEVNIEILERQAWVSKILGRKYDMGILRINVPYPDPDTVFNINFGSADAPSNWSGIDDPEIFELVAKARHEFDKDKRYDLYTKIQQLVLDRAYYAFLFLRPHAILATKEVIDISQDIAASIRLGEIKVVAK
jgi:peptide/nickel transport system substrate-binding protein